jgi:proteasome lid subunit RPN8/RPN11
MLRIAREVRDDLLAHAREGAPEEVCGVLGGTHDPEESTVTTALRGENAAADRRLRYELAPEDQLHLMQRVEDGGDDVVGWYHSHPAGPARPSGTDARLATWEGYSYVIVVLSGEKPRIGSWRWTGERFAEEEVDIDG